VVQRRPARQMKKVDGNHPRLVTLASCEPPVNVDGIRMVRIPKAPVEQWTMKLIKAAWARPCRQSAIVAGEALGISIANNDI
jgi:predicted methyltransferase